MGSVLPSSFGGHLTGEQDKGCHVFTDGGGSVESRKAQFLKGDALSATIVAAPGISASRR
jgi:hypothetical protein